MCRTDIVLLRTYGTLTINAIYIYRYLAPNGAFSTHYSYLLVKVFLGI